MHALTSLEPDTSKPAKPATRPWGARQRLILLGAVITVVALSLTVLLYLTRPRRAEIESFSPIQTWLVWQDLRQGVRRPPPGETRFLERVKLNRRWTSVLLVVVGLGVLIIAGSFLVPNTRPTRRAKRKGSGDRGQGAGDRGKAAGDRGKAAGDRGKGAGDRGKRAGGKGKGKRRRKTR